MGDTVSAAVVNGAFRPQRVTGQQRYATEIADRLVAQHGFSELSPAGRWRGSAAREWMWTLARLPTLAGGRRIISLTARAPLTAGQVLVVHDLFVLTDPDWYSRKYIATHAPALRRQLGAAAAVVAVSEPVAAQVRERYDGFVAVAPNAPSAVFTRPPDEGTEAFARLGVRKGAYLLAVGSLEPRKNLSALADAYGRLPAPVRASVPLLVVGGGAQIFRDPQVRWADGIISAGYVSDQELSQLYRGARAVVFPSKAEGFGLPLVEAAASGAAALVISDIPVFRWICGNGAAYVDPHSASSIAEGIEKALDGEVPSISVDLSRFDWDVSARVVAGVARDRAGAAR